jgi:hypothetical protein
MTRLPGGGCKDLRLAQRKNRVLGYTPFAVAARAICGAGCAAHPGAGRKAPLSVGNRNPVGESKASYRLIEVPASEPLPYVDTLQLFNGYLRRGRPLPTDSWIT